MLFCKHIHVAGGVAAVNEMHPNRSTLGSQSKYITKIVIVTFQNIVVHVLVLVVFASILNL